jgi:hypothetical protein
MSDRRCCIRGCRRVADLVVTPMMVFPDGLCRFYRICSRCKERFPSFAVFSVIPRRRRAKPTPEAPAS